MKWLLAFLVFAVVGCIRSEALVQPEVPEVVELKLSSPAFLDGSSIPSKFTCDGSDVSPELVIDGVPENAKSLVLIVDDPDAPSKIWEHWTLFNIPPDTKVMREGSVPAGSVQLMNDFRRVEWGGPCPPPGKVHHYRFRLSALDIVLSLGSSAKKSDVVAAMKGHVVAESVLVGAYRR